MRAISLIPHTGLFDLQCIYLLSLHREFSKHLITDHENSVSSERDRLRQRFSVASHPTLPLLVCSDGYTFTLLKLSSKHTLLETVRDLVVHSRRELGMEEEESSPRRDATQLSEGQGLGNSTHLKFRDFVAVLNVEREASLSKGALLGQVPPLLSLDVEREASLSKGALLGQVPSLPSLDGSDKGFLDNYLRNLDAGHIEFAGKNTGGASLDAISALTNKRCDYALRLALSYLQAATGLLLSCNPFVPCRGALPSSRSPDFEEVETSKLELHRLSNLLISTISKVLLQASLRSAFSCMSVSSEMILLSHDFIASLLKLISLDRIYQDHMVLSLSLANAVFITFLSGLAEKHYDFERLDKNDYTVVSLLEYACFVDKGVYDFLNLLEDVVQVILSTYEVHPSLFEEVSRSPPHSSSQSSNCMVYLGSALKAALKLTASLLKDMKLCCQFFSSARYSPRSKHHYSHLSNESMVCTLRNSTNNAISTLKSLQHYIHCLFKSCSYQCSYYSARKVSTLSNGKPITHSPTASNKRKRLLKSLLQYDLQTAMELVSECLKEYMDVEGVGEGEEDKVAGGSREVVSPSLSDAKVADILSPSNAWSQTGLTTSGLVRIESNSDRLLFGILGDLMALYFTNQKLMLSLTKSDHCSAARQVELSRTKVVERLKDGDICELWTVERTLSFLLLADKWERACDFVIDLGEWKKAFVLSSITFFHHQLLLEDANDCGATPHGYFFDLSCHLALTHILEVVGRIFKKQDRERFWKYDLDRAGSSTFYTSLRAGENFLCETFRVCVKMRLEKVLLSTAHHYINELVEVCSSLSIRVHAGFYLPAPPLYCTQPAITEVVMIK